MIAENKAEFFEQLERELEKLGVEDTAELMADLEWHFAEGELRGVPESETCRELGSIAEIARSCLDLRSEAINSMVARDVKRKRGVSLTKPGRSVPADPSLAEKSEEAQTLAVEETESGLPSYTPEHISSEVYPNAAQSGTAGADIGSPNTGTEGAAASANTAQNGSTGAAAEANTAASSANTAAPNGTAAASASAAASSNGGTFEKVGKAVDGAFDKAGKAINDAFGKAGNAVNGALNKAGSSFGIFRPSDSYRKNVNNNRSGGNIPQQFSKVKTKNGGGSKFVDTSGMKPKVNGTRLTFEIILDIFLWSWVIPLAFALVITTFGGAFALIDLGFKCIGGSAAFGQFKFLTRLLFMLGFVYAAVAMFCLSVMLFKLPIALVKNVVKRHAKAIYDI